jgi:PAS domain S-box-containing protein
MVHRFRPAILSELDYDIPRIRELALSAVPQSVVVTDSTIAGEPIIYANEAFEQLTGYSQSEIIGRNCNFMTSTGTSEQARHEIRTAIAERRRYRGVILNSRKDGTQFWNDLTIVPVDDGPKRRYCVGVQVDVTEQLTLEASLRESQKMEALGKLSGGIAHDFNNILALILGNAEIIAAEMVPGSALQEAATDIIEAADGGSNLVTRMLQFARGHGEATESVSVNQVVRDVLSLLQRIMGKTVTFESDLSEAVDTVQADRTMFQNALVNLALNSRDAMPNGGTIRFSTRRRSNVGPGLVNVASVTVTDSGTGMDEETRSRAFEPFFTTKDDGRGTGLGLSMVYRFARQSGGDAVISSTPGSGTSVSLLLPLDSSPTRPGEVSVASEKRVLVVEDDAKLRRIIAAQLMRAHYAVDDAATAEEALSLIQSGAPYDLVVSDIRLGSGMTGIDLVAAVRAIKPGISMLLITGFADELEDPPVHLEGVPILRKPFRSKDLLESCARMLGDVRIVH